MADHLLKACGLWQHISKAGRTYYVGRWGGLRVLVLENTWRQSDSEPSHYLCMAEAPEKPRQEPAGAAQGGDEALTSDSSHRTSAERRAAGAKSAPVRRPELAPIAADGSDWDQGDDLPF
jgi:hypothetical protein